MAQSKNKTSRSKNKKRQITYLKSVIESLISKEATTIIDLLIGKKHVNEFLIAKKLGLTINQTRNILYKLSDYGLVSFIRKKDKRKGWYIYYWTLNVYQSLVLLDEKLKKQLEELLIQLKNRNEKRFYFCSTCSLEVNEEGALQNDFTCPECEEIYVLSEGSEVIVELEKSVNTIKKQIADIEEELKIEGEKLEKKKVLKIKKQADERKAKRDAKKKEKERLKKKEEKKKGIKKTVKKKKVKKKVTKKVSKKKTTKKKKSKKKSSKK